MEDELRPDRSVEVTIDTTNEVLREIVLKDKRMKVSKMVRTLRISDGRVRTI